MPVQTCKLLGNGTAEIVGYMRERSLRKVGFVMQLLCSSLGLYFLRNASISSKNQLLQKTSLLEEPHKNPQSVRRRMSSIPAASSQGAVSHCAIMKRLQSLTGIRPQKRGSSVPHSLSFTTCRRCNCVITQMLKITRGFQKWKPVQSLEGAVLPVNTSSQRIYHSISERPMRDWMAQTPPGSWEFEVGVNSQVLDPGVGSAELHLLLLREPQPWCWILHLGSTETLLC